MGCGQPQVYVGLPQLPFLADRLLYTRADLLDILSAELVGELELVVIRGVDLVKRAPGMSARVPGSRGVVRFDENPRSRRDTSKRSTQAPVSSPCVDRFRAQGTRLPVHFDVIVESGRQSACHTEAGCGLAKMTEIGSLRKAGTGRCNPP